MVKMKLTTSQRRTASIVALSLTAFLGLDLVYQFTVHALWRQWLPTSLAAAVATTQPATTQPATTQPATTQPAGSQPADTQPAGTQPAHTQPATTQPTPVKTTEPPKNAKGKPPSAGKAQPKELHAAIRKRNIFTPYQVRKHGLALTGVLGNIALFSKGNETIGIEEGGRVRDLTVTHAEQHNGTGCPMPFLRDAQGVVDLTLTHIRTGGDILVERPAGKETL